VYCSARHITLENAFEIIKKLSDLSAVQTADGTVR